VFENIETIGDAMSATAKQLQDLLRQMEGTAPGIEASAIVTTQGLPIVAAMPQTVNEAIVAAMTAALLGVAERALTEIPRGKLQQVTIEAEQGYIILKGAGENAILTSLVKKTANLGMVFLALKRFSKEIERVLQG
jgi:predicted regulator of Ras-like GTPase activity (Roadblock/LC7/MglB family)